MERRREADYRMTDADTPPNDGYSIEERGDVTVVRLHRVMSQIEIFSMIDAVAALGNPRKRLWLLGENLRLSAEEMAQIGAYARSQVIGPARVAYVTDDNVTLGLANIHSVYRDDQGYEYQLFREEAEALAWLNAGECS